MCDRVCPKYGHDSGCECMTHSLSRVNLPILLYNRYSIMVTRFFTGSTCETINCVRRHKQRSITYQ